MLLSSSHSGTKSGRERMVIEILGPAIARYVSDAAILYTDCGKEREREMDVEGRI